MQSSALGRMQLANDLRHAIERGQLEIYLQPIVELGSEQVHKAEALLRWNHPHLGKVSPATFIPIAEETGLIVSIGEWVFDKTLLLVSQWQKLRDTNNRISRQVQISVNKSPRQFSENEQCNNWSNKLKSAMASSNSILVEITEGLLLEERRNIGYRLAELRESGLQLALDDFGTGYSAMSYLKKYSIDYLKIDQSFVRDMENNPSDQAIVEAIILMAHKLGMMVVAEGVETEAQRTILSLAECDFAQGYLLGRPIPADEFIEKYGKTFN